MTTLRPRLAPVFRRFLLLPLALAWLAAGTAPAGDPASPGGSAGGTWPQWRGPARDGLSAETGWVSAWPAGGPKVLWRKNVGAGYSAVAVADGRLYTMGNVEGYVKTTDLVWCLDATNGNEIWKFAAPSKAGSYPGPRSTPTVAGDAVFTLSRHGVLHCLDRATGAVRWQKDLRALHGIKNEPHAWGLASSPLVLGDRVILDLGKVLVLDKATGDLAFALGDEDAPGFSSAAVVEAGGRTYVSSFNAFGLAVYDLADRKSVGRHEWKTKLLANASTPVVSGDCLFVTSGYGRGCALLRVTAAGLERVYENTNVSSECIAGVLYQGHLYTVSGEQGMPGALKCLDFATGLVKWEHAGFPVGGGLTIADGKILHLTADGELVVAAAAPDAYRELAKAKVLERHCWTVPVLANGRIYCRNSKGDLVCLDVAAK